MSEVVRIERDTFGEIAVPNARLRGAQFSRSTLVALIADFSAAAAASEPVGAALANRRRRSGRLGCPNQTEPGWFGMVVISHAPNLSLAWLSGVHRRLSM